MTWIFGYGSLVHLARLEEFLGRALGPEDFAFGRLDGFRRAWNVATDNRLDLPGYKMYLDPATGERPEVFVTFLNLRQVTDTTAATEMMAVNGLAFQVSAEELGRIRERERNYRLVEVTGHWRPEEPGRQLPGRLLTSLGRPEAEKRFLEGRQIGRAVVRSHYRRIVHAAFGSRGEGWREEYEATTDPPEIPERELERVELP